MMRLKVSELEKSDSTWKKEYRTACDKLIIQNSVV